MSGRELVVYATRATIDAADRLGLQARLAVVTKRAMLAGRARRHAAEGERLPDGDLLVDLGDRGGLLVHAQRDGATKDGRPRWRLTGVEQKLTQTNTTNGGER